MGTLQSFNHIPLEKIVTFNHILKGNAVSFNHIPIITTSPSDIDIEFEGTTDYGEGSNPDDGFRNVIITGRQEGDVIDLNFQASCVITGNCTATVYYRKNGGAWQQVAQFTSTNTGTNEQVPNIDYNDTVDIRCESEISGLGDSVTTTALLINGTFDSGSGSITVNSPNTFSTTNSL